MLALSSASVSLLQEEKGGPSFSPFDKSVGTLHKFQEGHSAFNSLD